MKTKIVVMLSVLLLLSLFAVGCSKSYDYNAPPGQAPTGGGCGVGAPANVHVDSAEKVSSATVARAA